MARYTDIDKLIADGWHLERHGQSGRFLQSMSLADVQTEDVVKVVRCKDCKFLERTDCFGECSLFKDRDEPRGEMWPNDYCSYGVRKGE